MLQSKKLQAESKSNNPNKSQNLSLSRISSPTKTKGHKVFKSESDVLSPESMKNSFADNEFTQENNSFSFQVVISMMEIYNEQVFIIIIIIIFFFDQ
jgi:hypothetical protein